MAPLIFLFFIQAAMDLSHRKLDTTEFQKIELRHPTGSTTRGKLTGQRKAKGNKLHVTEILYVDDGVIASKTREHLILAASILERQFARIGLTMHVGNQNGNSKMVAMYFQASLKENGA